MSQQQVAQELLLHGFGLSFFIKLALVRLATAVKSDSNNLSFSFSKLLETIANLVYVSELLTGQRLY